MLGPLYEDLHEPRYSYPTLPILSPYLPYSPYSLLTPLTPLSLHLQDPRYFTNFAIYHRRFSTNTVPKWPLAQPMRMLAHNGARPAPAP